jgi:hypothetical protein
VVSSSLILLHPFEKKKCCILVENFVSVRPAILQIFILLVVFEGQNGKLDLEIYVMHQSWIHVQM